MAPEPARLIDAGAVQQAVEPGVEAIGTAQCGQVTPGSDERLLDGVLGLVGIAQDEPGGGVQPEDRGACQRGEGVMIAPSRSLHEFLLHHAPRRRRGRRGRAHRVWRGEPPRSFRIRPGDGATRYHRSPASTPAGACQPPVKIQEADAKTLLVAQGLPVPDWEVAHTVAEARAAAERILAAGAGAVVIKAQVLVGGRGKAGGVKLAASRGRGRAVAAAILGMDIKGITVRKVLVAAGGRHRPRVLHVGGPRPRRAAHPADGLGRGRRRDRAGRGRPSRRRSSAHHADPLLGLLDYQAREFAFAMGLGGHLKAAVAIAKGLVRTMLAYDADLVEINPLAIVRETGRRRHERRAPGLPRRQGHARRLGTPPPSRASRRCATPTRRIPPIARRARRA